MPKGPLVVTVTLKVVLTPEAREAWCEAFGIDNTAKALTEDVKKYVGNGITAEDFKDIGVSGITTDWK
jgi:hypothetical protein